MKGIKPVILAVLTAIFLKLFVFDFIIAQGHSMEPAIYDGQVLVISRLSYIFRQPEAGEVVIFYTPDGNIAVKRVTSLSNCSAAGFTFFAEGDNSAVSYDSRSYGAVNIKNIIGKVLGY
ncbi:MAG: signal peptidase I [Treponema sp.]|nr:signal peptidase I [Treponema sp.]